MVPRTGSMADKVKMIKTIHLTHLSRALNSLETNIDPENAPNESIITKYLNMVEEKYSKVVSDSEKVQEVLTEAEDIEKEIEDMEQLENKVIEAKHRANEMLKKLKKDTLNLDESSISENADVLNATLGLIEKLKKDSDSAREKFSSETLNATLKLIEKIKEESNITRERSLLPSLSIPRFDGNIEKYEEFIDAYEAVIQKYDHVENVEKFNLLRTHLDPPASELLEGFRTTNSEYPEALKLFKDTYGNKSLLKKIRISKLLNVEKYNGKGSLRPIYNKLRTNIRALESLGVKTEDHSLFLIPIVCSKISRDLNKKWYKKNDESINNLLQFIQDEVESTESAIYLEEAFAATSLSTEKRRYEQRQPNSQLNPATASALHTNTQKYCTYCQVNSHDTQNCKSLGKLSSSDVLQFLNNQRLCYCCMKFGHPARDCYHKSNLICKICHANHHTFLHNENSKFEDANVDSTSSQSNNAVTMSTNTSRNPSQKVIFQTAKAILLDEKHQGVKVNVLFDPGSDRSYIKRSNCEKLRLKFHEETLSIAGYSGKTESTKVYKIRHAIIRPTFGSNESRCVKLIETEIISPSINREAVPPNLLHCRYLQGIQLAENYTITDNEEIDVMIGLDYYWSFVTGRVKRQPGKPIVLESLLGWILQSNPDEEMKNSGRATTLTCITTSEGQELNKQLKRFWELEEVNQVEEMQWSKEDREVHTTFLKSITHESDNRYQVRLPVKPDIVNLASNKTGAITRCKVIQRRLNQSPNLGVKYREAMKDYLDNGFAEKVIECKEPKYCFYSPHHAVLKESSSTTKCRPVFDASAHEENSEALNHYLFKGPPLQPQLNSILIRFRLNPIAFTADVKKMFLMLKIHPEDRDFLRFIWEDPVKGNLTVYRHTVLPFGLRCSPYLAIATVQYHASQYLGNYPHVTKEIIENTYMDDLLSGAASPDEAVERYETSIKIMKDAGMTLHKWNSNHPQLLKRFNSDELSTSNENKKLLVEDQKGENISNSVLGIQWNSSKDCFEFEGEGILKKSLELRPSKRNVLKIAGKLFDPLGFLSPYIIQIKIYIQMLWERGLEWDELLPSDLKGQWEQWIHELQLLPQIQIPRYIGPRNLIAKPLELHTFGDASEAAYASVTYLKSVDENGNVYITLLYSKTKVSPIKLVSLPRLELLASVLAAKSTSYVLSSLQVSDLEVHMWTDSTIVLHWIKGSSRQYKTFVGNRVQLLQELTQPSSWKWCPGNENPADIPSRGFPISELVNSSIWWNGPSWLKGPQAEYPKQCSEPIDTNAMMKELKPNYSNKCLVISSTSIRFLFRFMSVPIIKPQDYSKLHHILTTTGYVKRFLHNITHKKEQRITGPLTVDEINAAKYLWLRYIQVENFPVEFKLLKDGKEIKQTSPLLKLSPFYDKKDDLIKMGGRLEFSNLTENEKHPIILPNKSYIVKILVEDIHRTQLHAGINHTLISLRDQYWVIRSRQLVRSIVKSCFICRKYNPVRLKVQQAPIPGDRIIQTEPFEVIGVDFTGPLLVYQGIPKIKKDPELNLKMLSYDGVPCKKMYICLYTCAVTRAVHLELTWDLTTESFINSFRRFTSTRGMVRVIYSDNAGTFTKAEKELKHYIELMKGKMFQEFLLKNSIEWKFILECSPWWGGFYERLMKNIKQPLKKILGKSRLNVDQISTILKEIEAQINSRPICSVSDEASEQKYLTPASFLIGRNLMNMPLKPRPQGKPKSDQRVLNKLLRQQNSYLDLIWRTWKEEYLRGLGTINDKVNHTDSVKEGEVVLVGSFNLPKTVWEVGVIQKLTQGRDGRYRTASIKTSRGLISRSVQHLSRLEADCLDDYNQYSC